MKRSTTVVGRIGAAAAVCTAVMFGTIGAAEAAVPVPAGSTLLPAGPSDCLQYYNTEITFVAWCREGTGTFRATAKCAVDWWPDYRVYGSWVSVGNASIAECRSWDEPIYGGSFQVG